MPGFNYIGQLGAADVALEPLRRLHTRNHSEFDTAGVTQKRVLTQIDKIDQGLMRLRHLYLGSQRQAPRRLQRYIRQIEAIKTVLARHGIKLS